MIVTHLLPAVISQLFHIIKRDGGFVSLKETYVVIRDTPPLFNSLTGDRIKFSTQYVAHEDQVHLT